MPPALLAPAHIIGRLRDALSSEPDQALVRARRSSEQLVALVRLGIIALFTISTIVFSILDGQLYLSTVVMGAAAFAYGFLLLLLPQKFFTWWTPWAVSTIDVTFITACLTLLAVFNLPLAAMNNRVTFEAYFVAVTVSAMRFDWRLCLYTAVLSVFQFLGLTAYVATHWDLGSLQTTAHGIFIPVQHVNRLLLLIGNGAAAVAVARWARHLRLMVGTDQLTGLLQRRPFLERIEEELSRADVGRTTLTIAIFDVDQFHEYNRQFGHPEGDRALVRVAEQLKLGVRTTDLVARYGGEEFVVAFPRLDILLASRRVEALRAGIEQMSTGAASGVTVSAGLASWPADGETFQEVLKRADERLYAAKASGRNTVIGPIPLPVRGLASADPGA